MNMNEGGVLALSSLGLWGCALAGQGCRWVEVWVAELQVQVGVPVVVQRWWWWWIRLGSTQFQQGNWTGARTHPHTLLRGRQDTHARKTHHITGEIWGNMGNQDIKRRKNT